MHLEMHREVPAVPGLQGKHGTVGTARSRARPPAPITTPTHTRAPASFLQQGRTLRCFCTSPGQAAPLPVLVVAVGW